MDIKVKIGDTERVWGKEASTSWIHEQIKARLAAGEPVCIIVTINGNGVNNLMFSAGDCPSSGGASTTPNFTGEEQRIIDTWQRIGVQENPVNAGKITAFIEQISRI